MLKSGDISRGSIDLATDLLIAALPLLASLALYLPSGALMPFRLVTIVLLVLASWRVITTRTIPTPRLTACLGLVVCCFIVFGAIGLIRFGARTSLDDAMRMGYFIALVLAVAVLATRRRTTMWLVYGWLLAAAVCAVPAVWEVATGQHLTKHLPAQEIAGTIPGWNIIASFFDNPNLYAYQGAIVLLLLPIAFSGLPRGWRWLCLPFGLLIGYLLMWTQGRIAMLSVLLGLGLWALRSRIGRWLAAVSITAFMIASWLKVSIAVAVWAEVDNAIIEGRQEGASTWVRIQLARSGWWIAQQTQYLGAGPGGFASWSLDASNPYVYGELNNAHWGMVEVLSNYGIWTLAVVVIALLAIVFVATKRSLRLDASTLDGALEYAPVVLAITLPALSASHSTWLQQPLTAAHVALLVVLLAWAEARGRCPHEDTAGQATHLDPSRSLNE